MDIATLLSPDLSFDWALANGALEEDDGLLTAVTLSLFSDRVANADDPLPSGFDRRGWWGDAYLPPLANGSPDRLGSRLWLLARAKQLPETAQRAQTYCREALQWGASDGLFSASVPLPVFPHPGMMAITIELSQIRTASGAAGDRRYRFLWDMTEARLTEAGSVIGGF